MRLLTLRVGCFALTMAVRWRWMSTRRMISSLSWTGARQALIESCLLQEFPSHAIYGEEGVRGDPGSEFQWVIDPIDGTVNYFYGIPHFAVSIALRQAGRIIVGVIYDPMRDELWSVEEGGVATLNGLPAVVSDRKVLSEAVVSVGMAKSLANINSGLRPV